MSETNQLQRKNANEITVINQSQNSVSVIPIEQQLGLSLEGLTDEQQQAIRNKIINKCVDLKIDTITAQNRLTMSSVEMNQIIQNANSLSQINRDFSISSEHKTATGRANIKVSNYKDTSKWVVIGIIGVILILAIAKGC